MKGEEDDKHDAGDEASPLLSSRSLAMENAEAMASLDLHFSEPKALEFPALSKSHGNLQQYRDFPFANADRFAAMGALDILRESVVLLRANSSVLMLLMLIFISPVSALLLSRTLLHGKLARTLAGRLYTGDGAVDLLHYFSLLKSMYESLSQLVFTYVLSAPILFTVWLLAKASVTCVVSGTYTKKYVSFVDSLVAGAKLWKRVACTYAWNCLLLAAFILPAAAIFYAVVSLMNALQFSADLIFLMELALGLFYAVIFAQMLVVESLASVVAILEESYGFAALSRSFGLLKRKIQVALYLFCGVLLGTVMIETLYQYRVIGIPPSNYAINTASRLWEGPLLVFMHSFLLLLDCIMGCVFYFSCKSAVLLPENLYQTDENQFF